MRLPAFCVALLFLAAVTAHGYPEDSPWEMQPSGASANLRGVHSIGGGVAWVSGAGGTVLRTEDSGFVWQQCGVPPDAAKLDFRGIWAWDAQTAIVMSSGPGDQSRLYKTIDGCRSWRLLYTNPDAKGFWDAMQFRDRENGYLLGDPVDGRFVIFQTVDGGAHWKRDTYPDLAVPNPQTSAFAASNSALWVRPDSPFFFGTSGPGGPYLFTRWIDCTMNRLAICGDNVKWERNSLPLANQTASAGIFAIASMRFSHPIRQISIAVGGDYRKPSGSSGTAAYTNHEGIWTAAETPPHGYRSAVGWDADDHAWIAVGTNGSDLSYDQGKTWRHLDDGNWNALSLPWAVGPNGRIGKLRQIETTHAPAGESR